MRAEYARINTFGSYIATVVECAVSDTGEVELRRVTTAVDPAGVAKCDLCCDGVALRRMPIDSSLLAKGASA